MNPFKIISTLGFLCVAAVRAQEPLTKSQSENVSPKTYITLESSSFLQNQQNLAEAANDIFTTTITNIIPFTSFYCPNCETITHHSSLPTTTISEYLTITSTYCQHCSTFSSAFPKTKTRVILSQGPYSYTTTVSTRSTYVVGSNSMTTPEKVYHVDTPARIVLTSTTTTAGPYSYTTTVSTQSTYVVGSNSMTTPEKVYHVIISSLGVMDPTVTWKRYSKGDGDLTKHSEGVSLSGYRNSVASTVRLISVEIFSISEHSSQQEPVGSNSFSADVSTESTRMGHDQTEKTSSSAFVQDSRVPTTSIFTSKSLVVEHSLPSYTGAGADVSSPAIIQGHSSLYVPTTRIPTSSTPSLPKPMKTASIVSTSTNMETFRIDDKTKATRELYSLSSTTPILPYLHAVPSNKDAFETSTLSPHATRVQQVSTTVTGKDLFEFGTSRTDLATVMNSAHLDTKSLSLVPTTDSLVIGSSLLPGSTSTLPKSKGNVVTSSSSGGGSYKTKHTARTLTPSTGTYSDDQQSSVDGEQRQSNVAVSASIPASQQVTFHFSSSSTTTPESVEVGHMIGEFTGAAPQLSKISLGKFLLMAAFLLV